MIISSDLLMEYALPVLRSRLEGYPVYAPPQIILHIRLPVDEIKLPGYYDNSNTTQLHEHIYEVSFWRYTRKASGAKVWCIDSIRKVWG